MKVKLMLAVALSHEARLLILDEPTSGLDPSARDEIGELLSDFVLDENRSVFFSTHITTDLDKIADFIVLILGGRILYSGTKDELLNSFICVKGGSEDLKPEQWKKVIGARVHAAGFDGMVRTEDLPLLPENLLAEPVTLDEIIIYLNREESHA